MVWSVREWPKFTCRWGGGHRLVIAPSHHSHSLKKSQLRLIHTSFFLERWEKMSGLKNQRKKTLNKSVTPPPQKKKKRYLPKSAWSPIFCFKTRQCSPNNDCFYKIGLGVVGNTFFAEQSRGGGGQRPFWTKKITTFPVGVLVKFSNNIRWEVAVDGGHLKLHILQFSRIYFRLKVKPNKKLCRIWRRTVTLKQLTRVSLFDETTLWWKREKRSQASMASL